MAGTAKGKARERRAIKRKRAYEEAKATEPAVLQIRRRRSFRHDYIGSNVICVVTSGDTWSAYLRRMTSRPGWSVAKLARESGIARSSIFKWIAEGAEAITIESVYRIADALDDDRANALRAAGNLPPDRDPEVDLILAANITERDKAAMIDRLMRRREEERARRIEDLKFVLGEDDDAAQRAG